MNGPQKSLSRRRALRARAQLYRHIRDFFYAKNVLEVETPIFSQFGNPDPTIESLVAQFHCTGSSESTVRYAHTSPEFAMKRLLVEDVGPIYQICKVFRLGELGSLHNPEFSMLEWYRPGFTYLELMSELEELLQVLGVVNDCRRISFASLFQQYLNLDIFNASIEELRACALYFGLDVVGVNEEYDDWCNLLLSHLIEPKLASVDAIFVVDYPISQAALANIREGTRPVAERFELYLNGIEVANGYQELTDVDEYKHRFQRDNKRRELLQLQRVNIDEHLLRALQLGLPDCAGVAVGLDRLLMCILNISKINQSVSFDFMSA